VSDAGTPSPIPDVVVRGHDDDAVDVLGMTELAYIYTRFCPELWSLTLTYYWAVAKR